MLGKATILPFAKPFIAINLISADVDGLSSNIEVFLDILRTFWCAIMDLLATFGAKKFMTLQTRPAIVLA